MTDNGVNDLKRVCRISAVISAALLLMSGPAAAGMLSQNGTSDPDWTDSQEFWVENTVPDYVFARVDYAVYEPSPEPGVILSAFQNAFGEQADPSNGQEYVYVYQIFNTGPELPPPDGNGAIYLFTVGLDGNEVVHNIGYLYDALPDPGLEPTSWSFQGTAPRFTSAAWSFMGGPLPLGDPGPKSAILIFTSPSEPEWDTGALVGTFAGDSQPLPSPVPEPTALILLAIGAVGFLLFRIVCR